VYGNNRARYAVGSNWSPIGNTLLRIQWTRDRWRHVTPKGQGRDPDIFEAQYLDNRERYMVGSYWLPIGNYTLGIQWSHDRWRHVTRKVKVVTPIHVKLNMQYITSCVRPLWWCLVIVRDNYSCLVVSVFLIGFCLIQIKIDWLINICSPLAQAHRSL